MKSLGVVFQQDSCIISSYFKLSFQHVENFILWTWKLIKSTAETHMPSLFNFLWRTKYDLKSRPWQSNNSPRHYHFPEMHVCSHQASWGSHETPIPMATRPQEFKVQTLTGDCVFATVFLSSFLFFMRMCANHSAIDNVLCRFWQSAPRSYDKETVTIFPGFSVKN